MAQACLCTCKKKKEKKKQWNTVKFLMSFNRVFNMIRRWGKHWCISLRVLCMTSRLTLDNTWVTFWLTHSSCFCCQSNSVGIKGGSSSRSSVWLPTLPTTHDIMENFTVSRIAEPNALLLTLFWEPTGIHRP